MTYPQIVLPKITRHCKSFRHSAAFMLATLILMISAATTLTTAQTYTMLYGFDGTGGRTPEAALVQGLDGNLYGTTYGGGTQGVGTVFKITPTGSLTPLYSFCSQSNCADGEYPVSALVLASDGNLYGTTSAGANGGGSVFRISPSGILTTLYAFGSRSGDGSGPAAALVQDSDDTFYGTTQAGGVYGHGTIFKMTPSGSLTTLYSFCHHSACWNGVDPSGLVQATDGNFYGTALYGGETNGGTVFKITPGGGFSRVHSFGWNGEGLRFPAAPLVQAADGTFYGTTIESGGDKAYGTVFKIGQKGKLTVLTVFSWYNDGAHPQSAMIQASDGNLYGTTVVGGGDDGFGNGTVYSMTASGKLTALYVFSDDVYGPGQPNGLLQATNGIFYGTTINGSDASAYGAVFSLSTGLPPFVRLISTSGKVGTPIKVLGQGLTGTTAVSFNGTPATFKVWSETYLKATVPSGATTGPVTVTTPTGVLTSNHEFRVRPVILNVAPASGAAGTPVVITGTSFTQTTKVTFGGGVATATFTVDSDTQVTAAVPAGAPTGYIVLTTDGGKSRSPVSFTVTP